MHFCHFDCAWRLRCVLSFACISTMGSRGTNNSLQTTPPFPIASSGEEALLQNAISSAGENVVPPTSHQASHASLQSAGPAVAGVSPELVALISQTVQAALAAERASASAAAIATSLSNSTAVIPSSDTPPCSVGIPDALPSLASSQQACWQRGQDLAYNQSKVGPAIHLLCLHLCPRLRFLLCRLSLPAPAPRTYACRRAGRFPISPPVLSVNPHLCWITLLLLVLVSRPCLRRWSHKSWLASTWTWASYWR